MPAAPAVQPMYTQPQPGTYPAPSPAQPATEAYHYGQPSQGKGMRLFGLFLTLALLGAMGFFLYVLYKNNWSLDVAGVSMLCRLQGLWHVGLFPEQMPHWQWMLERMAEMRSADPEAKPRVLNLFGYTGAASLIAANAGAEVTHVDASKKAVAWARENQAASKLTEAPVRWIVDDAAKFTAREVRRGRTYNIILVDPPKFGRGPAGETWDLFAGLKPLLGDCGKLLDQQSAGLVLTVYAIRASTLAFAQLVSEVLGERGGTLDCGELVILEQGSMRVLPTSLFTRWRTP